jgi:hypothetical protein
MHLSQFGGIGALVPERRNDLAKLGVRATKGNRRCFDSSPWRLAQDDKAQSMRRFWTGVSPGTRP